MVKYFLLLLITVAGINSVYSQSPFEWKTIFSGNYGYGSEPLVCTSDENGYLYTTGFEITPGLGETSLLDIYVTKVSPAGEILWHKSYGVPGYNEDDPISICLDELGQVYILGITIDTLTHSRKGVILKYSKNGNFLWEKKFQAYNFTPSVTKMVYSNQNLFVGMNFEHYPSTIGKILKFSAITGDSLNIVSIPKDSVDIYDFTTDKKGNLYLNFGHYYGWMNYTGYLAKYDINTNLKWVIPLDSVKYFYSLAVDNFSNVYFSGMREIFLGGRMLTTVKFDSSGNKQWMREYLGSINTYSLKNSLDSSGNLIVLGTSRTQNLSDTNNFALIKYTPAGDTLWVRKEKIGNPSDYTAVLDFGLDRQNNIYMIFPLSYNQATPDNKFCISKYSPEGNLLKKIYNNHYLNTDRYNFGFFEVLNSGICYVIGELEINPNYYWSTYFLKVSGTVGINNLSNSISNGFSLKQNYPNPFNASTQIEFELPKPGNVKIVLYDLSGKEVQVIENKFYSQGSHSINFDANRISSGVYFYKILYGTYSVSKTMVFIK